MSNHEKSIQIVNVDLLLFTQTEVVLLPKPNQTAPENWKQLKKLK